MSSQLILIDSNSEFEACEKIHAHLEKLKNAGWTPGGIQALVDGWKNQYEFIRNGETIMLEFDLRPSLSKFNSEMDFTLHSLMLTQPNALDVMRSIRDGKSPNQKNYWLGYLFWVIVGIFVFFIFFNST